MMRCAREGCKKEGTHRPVMSFTALCNPQGARYEMEWQMVLCEEHATPDAITLIDESWERIEEGLAAAGAAPPDRASVELSYRQLQ